MFEQNLLRELDFRIECDNARRCARNLAGNPSVAVPETFPGPHPARASLRRLSRPRGEGRWLPRRGAAHRGRRGGAALCSERVITMDFAPGVKVDDVAGLRAAGFDPAAVGALVASAFGEMIFLHGFVHCDPHPGNMFVRWRAVGASRRAPQIVLLDHGLYREVAPGTRLTYCKLWEALVLQVLHPTYIHRVKDEIAESLCIESRMPLLNPYASSQGCTC